MIEASANIGCSVVLSVAFYRMDLIVRDPFKESPPPPFKDTRRDGVHAQGIVKVVVLPPNCGGAVVEHCGKYTVGHGVGRGSRPEYRPWSCGDRAGVLPAPAASCQPQQAAWSSL